MAGLVCNSLVNRLVKWVNTCLINNNNLSDKWIMMDIDKTYNNNREYLTIEIAGFFGVLPWRVLKSVLSGEIASYTQ